VVYVLKQMVDLCRDLGRFISRFFMQFKYMSILSPSPFLSTIAQALRVGSEFAELAMVMSLMVLGLHKLVRALTSIGCTRLLRLVFENGELGNLAICLR
jgi:hypothetical protein